MIDNRVEEEPSEEMPLLKGQTSWAIILFSAIHVLSLAISTYIASIEIESILVSGIICAITGLLLAIIAIRRSRYVVAVAAGMTPLIALTLLILESQFLHLGPQRAALPFCIVFFINQAITSTIILIELQWQLTHSIYTRLQFTLRSLLVLTTAFAICTVVAKFLMQQGHNTLMLIAFGLMGLTIVGLVAVGAWAFIESTNRQ